MNNKPDFQTEFIRFLKSRGYPNSGIFCNAKIGETHVDYLITVPNPNDNLAIIVAQKRRRANIHFLYITLIIKATSKKSTLNYFRLSKLYL